MAKIFKILFIITFLIAISPWIHGIKEKPVEEITDIESGFEHFALQAYEKLNNTDLKYDVFEYSLKGFYNLTKERLIHNTDYITIIDYRISCNEKRLFIIGTDSIKILMNTLVAHGKNSGIMYPEDFSNKIHSNKSSLGFFITGNTYIGKHGYSLRLNGVEREFNDNAAKRAVVIHGAGYVSENSIASNGRIGRSFGCPVVPEEISKEVIDLIKDKSCLFIFYPDDDYLSGSKYLNSSNYLSYF